MLRMENQQYRRSRVAGNHKVAIPAFHCVNVDERNKLLSPLSHCCFENHAFVDNFILPNTFLKLKD